MKKFVSFVFAFCLAVFFSISADAAEIPLRLFSVEPDNVSPEEVFSFAAENSFGGIVVDLRGSDSVKFYGNFSKICGDELEVFVFASKSVLEKLPENTKIIADENISEEELAFLSGKHGAENTALFIPFGDEDSLASAKDYFEKGLFKTVFAENLFSSYSEYGYEQYLLDLSSAFPGAEIVTFNDLGRVLSPVVRGDFFGDMFELNNQYLINKIHGSGFCVLDYSELSGGKNPSASSLLEYFGSKILEEYADFSISQEFEITRPTGSSLNIATEKYTIFGTSDPEKPLYLGNEEIERISSSGLFAVTVEVPKKGKTFTFYQGEKSLSVTLKRDSGGGAVSTVRKLSSCAPASAAFAEPGKTEVVLSCTGPSGGKVTASFCGKTVELKQVAYADPGIPARFRATVDISGDYPDDEVTCLGNVTYTLVYGGNRTSYESSGQYYYFGKDSVFSVEAAAELSGVEKEPGDSGNYITTLRTGCSDYVTGIAENGWYEISCGGYINPSHCSIVTGKGDITNRISGALREIGSNYEKLVLDCSVLPAFTGEIRGKVFSITLYNTEWSDFSSADADSKLMSRIETVDNGDGSITINFSSEILLWGWDVFTDPENKTFSVVLKGTPKLSENPAKPLSGTTITVCAGHGGPDPGALSVAGEKGVNEAQINIANALMIAESLENLGAKIVLLITFDEKLDTYGRTDPARYSYSDLYICCHANSVAENSQANLWCGTYVYYHYDHSAEFAKKLCDYISAATKRDNEGSESGYYSVTRLTMCPAVMLEVGFVSNPKEFESLTDHRDIQKTANAVTKAVLEILDN